MLRLILILGPPGAGKSTQASLLGVSLGIPVVSCGGLFRRHVERNTVFGSKAKEYIAQGKLTPDVDTAAMLLSHVADVGSGSAIMEGFPRTAGQVDLMASRAWSGIAAVSEAILLNTKDDVLLGRLLARRVCPQCGRTYALSGNLDSPICTEDGAALIARRDDRPDVLSSRIALYRKEELPVVEHYRSEGKLREYDADQNAETLNTLLLEHLTKLLGPAGGRVP